MYFKSGCYASVFQVLMTNVCVTEGYYASVFQMLMMNVCVTEGYYASVFKLKVLNMKMYVMAGRYAGV